MSKRGWKHGTRYAYFKKGCRCDECVEGRRREDRERRQRRVERAAADPTVVPHGSPFASRDWGCHCQLCTSAATAYYRKEGVEPRRVRLASEIAAAVETYQTQGPAAAAEAAEVSVTTIGKWAKAAGATYTPKPAHTAGSAAYREGCRCEDCAADVRRRYEEAKASRHARVKAGSPDVPHGTESGYVNWGCRCDPCKAAGSEHNRNARARRIARTA